MGMHIAHALQIAMFEDALATTTFQPWLALVPVRLGRSKGWPRRSSKEATQKKDVDGEVFGSSNNQWGRPQAQSVKIQCKAGEPMQCNALLFCDYQTMQLSTGRVQFWCIVGFWWDRKCSSLVTGGTRNCFLSGLPLPQAHQHQGSMAHHQHQHHGAPTPQPGGKHAAPPALTPTVGDQLPLPTAPTAPAQHHEGRMVHQQHQGSMEQAARIKIVDRLSKDVR